MIVLGETHCDNCKKRIEWYYQVGNRASSGKFDVDKLPLNRTRINGRPIKIEENKYRMYCKCPQCLQRVDIVYSSNVAIE